MPHDLAAAIRGAREARGISLRELARRVGVSPSFVSQVERGKANPSVGTLYALVEELGTTVGELMGDRQDGRRSAAAGRRAAAGWPRVEEHVQRAGSRHRITMSGVVWERLTADEDPFVDFLQVAYAPGSASCPPDERLRHAGREYGVVLDGELVVEVGADAHHLHAGDAISFDSTTPHRLSNPGDRPCRAVWFVLDRRPTPPVP